MIKCIFSSHVVHRSAPKSNATGASGKCTGKGCRSEDFLEMAGRVGSSTRQYIQRRTVATGSMLIMDAPACCGWATSVSMAPGDRKACELGLDWCILLYGPRGDIDHSSREVEGSSHAGRNGYIKKTYTEGISAYIPCSTLMIL